jgi:hypothetical protein
MAPQISAALLHFARPSLEAIEISERYLSKLSVAVSLIKTCTFSLACRPVLSRLMNAVFFFRDESNEWDSERGGGLRFARRRLARFAEGVGWLGWSVEFWFLLSGGFIAWRRKLLEEPQMGITPVHQNPRG